MAQGDERGALAAYETAMRLRPDAVMPQVNAAVVVSQQGRLQEAIRYLREAYRASPGHGAVNLNLGLALAESGDLAAAERHLRVALQDPACRAQAAYNCAVLVGRRDAAAAAELCRLAVADEPENARYAETLNYYLRAAGLPPEEAAAPRAP